MSSVSHRCGLAPLYPLPITSGYTAIDLKSINFAVPDPAYLKMKVEPTNPKDVKKIESADSIKLTAATD